MSNGGNEQGNARRQRFIISKCDRCGKATKALQNGEGDLYVLPHDMPYGMADQGAFCQDCIASYDVEDWREWFRKNRPDALRANEQGNATAALCGVCGASLIGGRCEWCDAAQHAVQSTLQAAFQVGDRVRFSVGRSGFVYEGTVSPTELGDDPSRIRVIRDDGIAMFPLHRKTSLIARATPAPAPAPAQPVPERNSFAMTMPCWFGKHGECDGTLRIGNVATPDVDSRPCGCECHHTPPASEPATPAPAATLPTLDTHTLGLPVMVRCTACDGSGTERHGEGHLPCPYCAGLGYSDMHIRLSDEAVDRLAGELAKRMRSVAR